MRMNFYSRKYDKFSQERLANGIFLNAFLNTLVLNDA